MNGTAALCHSIFKSLILFNTFLLIEYVLQLTWSGEQVTSCSWIKETAINLNYKFCRRLIGFGLMHDCVWCWFTQFICSTCQTDPVGHCGLQSYKAQTVQTARLTSNLTPGLICQLCSWLLQTVRFLSSSPLKLGLHTHIYCHIIILQYSCSDVSHPSPAGVKLTCSWSSNIPAITIPSPASRYEGSTWRRIIQEDSVKERWSFSSPILTGLMSALHSCLHVLFQNKVLPIREAHNCLSLGM